MGGRAAAPRPAARPRPARPGDLPAILALQAEALRGLARSVYTPGQIEAFIARGTMDTALIDSGRYYVIDHRATLIGGAGWSYGDSGGGDGPTALVRAVYVHPDWARRGLGRLLMRYVHAMARQAGCRSLRLTATLAGVPLYQRLGYAETGHDRLPLPGGLSLAVRQMARSAHR